MSQKQHPSKDLSQLASLGLFLCDKAYFFVFYIITFLLTLLFLLALKASIEIIIIVGFLWTIFVLCTLVIEYLRKRTFYYNLTKNVACLDQSYLVLETLEEPNFYDGKIFFEVLYKIDKSMAENVQAYYNQSQEFRNYIEMWVHEAKTPLATLSIMSHDRKIAEQLKRLDDCVEQVLYYVRAENAERDYSISEVSLEKVIGGVATRNQETLLAKHIELQVQNLDQKVYTDAKWLEFILNQIISNSIKYGSTKITIKASVQNHKTTLEIIDNGIGIRDKDLPRIFDKSFTGQNGHGAQAQYSTGMGLYIAKTLCDKLGHQISATSRSGEFTAIKLIFSKNQLYEVIEHAAHADPNLPKDEPYKKVSQP